jgi:hypothetical protein
VVLERRILGYAYEAKPRYSLDQMSTPPELTEIVNQLNREFDRTETDALEGLSLVRTLLARFPDNDILVQFFASFSNILLFAETYRQQVQVMVGRVLPDEADRDLVQATGEELSTLIGRVLEVRINVNRLKARLENFL